jgi:hypothetical protein
MPRAMFENVPATVPSLPWYVLDLYLGQLMTMVLHDAGRTKHSGTSSTKVHPYMTGTSKKN